MDKKRRVSHRIVLIEFVHGKGSPRLPLGTSSVGDVPILRYGPTTNVLSRTDEASYPSGVWLISVLVFSVTADFTGEIRVDEGCGVQQLLKRVRSGLIS